MQSVTNSFNPHFIQIKHDHNQLHDHYSSYRQELSALKSKKIYNTKYIHPNKKNLHSKSELQCQGFKVIKSTVYRS